MEIVITDEELKQINGDKAILTNLVVSRALYQESLEYKYNEEQQKEIEFFIENEKLKYYISQHLGKEQEIKETSIIEEYNKNKELFERDKIPFAEARKIIMNNLQQQIRNQMSEEVIRDLISRMPEKISLTKEQVLFSHGNPNYIKAFMVLEILAKDSEAIEFFAKNKELMLSLVENVKLNYYVELIVKSQLNISQKEVEDTYKKEKERLVNIPVDEAYKMIYAQMADVKSHELKNKLSMETIKKYNLEKIVDEYLKKK